LLYASVRAAAIAERAAESSSAVTALTQRGERALMLKLAAFADAISDVTETLEPHRLNRCLYGLAGVVTSFGRGHVRCSSNGARGWRCAR
jgi:arginyl-tRNA synthetase